MTTDNKAKQNILNILRQADEIYAIMSSCTNLPFVCCDEDTYDDEIFLFQKPEDAQAFGQTLQKSNNPVQITKIENKFFLGFYTSLYSMGVNCILVGKGTAYETKIQLEELITMKQPDAAGKMVRIENPALHLTAAYFMQKIRSGQQNQDAIKEEVKELQDEMQAHFRKGKYIVAVDDEKRIPILKNKNGETYQPVFTDMAEFMKFNKERKFKTAIVEFEGIAKLLSSEAVGVVMNPFGVNVTFQMKRNK